MTPRVVVPPVRSVTVQDIKEQARIDGSEEDGLISSYIEAASLYVETILDRALEAQTLESYLSSFPAGEIIIPRGPLVSVESVAYTDADGVDQTIDSANYEIDDDPWDARIVPVSGYDWPAVAEKLKAVRIRWVAGTGAPEPVRQAIRMLAAHYVDNRGLMVRGSSVRDDSFGMDMLVRPYRRVFA